MVDTPPAVRLEDLTPLPYQQALAAHLQANEPEVWRWAAGADSSSAADRKTTRWVPMDVSEAP